MYENTEERFQVPGFRCQDIGSCTGSLPSVITKKMLKMKVDPGICMKTNGDGQNDRRNNGHFCIVEAYLSGKMDFAVR